MVHLFSLSSQPFLLDEICLRMEDYSGYCRSGSTEVFWIPACAGMTGFFVLHNYDNCYKLVANYERPIPT
jgi:hypothetical protein